MIAGICQHVTKPTYLTGDLNSKGCSLEYTILDTAHVYYMWGMISFSCHVNSVL